MKTLLHSSHFNENIEPNFKRTSANKKENENTNGRFRNQLQRQPLQTISENAGFEIYTSQERGPKNKKKIESLKCNTQKLTTEAVIPVEFAVGIAKICSLQTTFAVKSKSKTLYHLWRRTFSQQNCLRKTVNKQKINMPQPQHAFGKQLQVNSSKQVGISTEQDEESATQNGRDFATPVKKRCPSSSKGTIPLRTPASIPASSKAKTPLTTPGNALRTQEEDLNNKTHSLHRATFKDKLSRDHTTPLKRKRSDIGPASFPEEMSQESQSFTGLKNQGQQRGLGPQETTTNESTTGQQTQEEQRKMAPKQTPIKGFACSADDMFTVVSPQGKPACPRTYVSEPVATEAPAKQGKTDECDRLVRDIGKMLDSLLLSKSTQPIGREEARPPSNYGDSGKHGGSKGHQCAPAAERPSFANKEEAAALPSESFVEAVHGDLPSTAHGGQPLYFQKTEQVKPAKHCNAQIATWKAKYGRKEVGGQSGVAKKDLPVDNLESYLGKNSTPATENQPKDEGKIFPVQFCWSSPSSSRYKRNSGQENQIYDSSTLLEQWKCTYCFHSNFMSDVLCAMCEHKKQFSPSSFG